MAVSTAIPWTQSLDDARARARESNKPILLEFFHPTSGGCQAMDTVTYLDPQVSEFLRTRFICVRISIERDPKLADRYNAIWTPALLCLDADDRVHARTFGFLPPEEFLAHLALWEGRFALDRGDYVRAERCFDEVATRWPHASSAPEALYWKGVAFYKRGDRQSLASTWQELTDRYPESAWQVRTSFLFER